MSTRSSGGPDPAPPDSPTELAPRGPRLGPLLDGDGAEFAVWAPHAGRVAVRVSDRTTPLEREQRGVWRGSVAGARAGDDYLLVLDGERERPDPRSRWQPHGVHGPSRLVDPGPPPAPFTPPALRELITYELHCGTFTPEGTFDAAAGKLSHLVDLGVNAVEVMPVAAFGGRRGWGYDGVGLYAVHDAYGGPAALRRFVDACHQAASEHATGPDGNHRLDNLESAAQRIAPGIEECGHATPPVVRRHQQQIERRQRRQKEPDEVPVVDARGEHHHGGDHQY